VKENYMSGPRLNFVSGAHKRPRAKTKTELGKSGIAIAAIFVLSLAFGSSVFANHGAGDGKSFLFLQPGFTQDVFGVSQHFMGGVAFAPDGDPWVDDCAFGGSHLHRYDAQSTPPAVNGTPVHTESIHGSNAGCGLTNHPNGSMYSNLSAGVVRLNANTGAQTGGPFGPAGNALGIAVQVSTGNLIYVGSNGTLFFVNESLTASGTFSAVTTGNFVDGIAFDPTGGFLFVANRVPTFRLTILNGTTGALVQHVLMTSEPDGISFHADTPKFVVTNNTDGTMTRFDFPGDNYTLPPAQSLFASGGFRGDLSQVGDDGCIYLTQGGTRYNNLISTTDNSLVRICGGFAPPVRSTPGKVTGGGYIEAPPDGGGGGILPGLAEMTIVDGVKAGVGGKANFGFVIKLEEGQTTPTGNLLYHDHAADVRIKSTSYDRLVIACPHATFTGTAEVNGVSKQYQVDVDDIDEPGSSPGVGPDTFTIKVLDGSYMATGPLVGGNIQVHKPPECG
jgi:hypothetical protein